MKISIITVCHNASNWIKQSIESVIHQDYKNIEYIIIDGDSQDNTREIVERYSDAITKFISEPDHGIYNAMNKGIKIASGDYLYFLGSDDYLIDNSVISDVVDFIAKNPEHDFFYGNIEVRPSSQAPYIHKPPKPEFVLEELVCGCLPHQASFAHFSLFDKLKVGLFNEHYNSASDYEWFVKLASFVFEEGKQFSYFDRTIASYNGEGTSSNIKSALTEMFEIQNNSPIYQRENWVKCRINKYQQILINPNGHWDLNRRGIDDYQNSELKEKIIFLETELFQSQMQIKAMKSSKFWKLRTLWFDIKNRVI